MDPLSVTASIIGVLEISAKIGSYCLKYIQSSKNARQEQLRLVREIGGLHIVLTTLKQLAEREESPPETDPDQNKDRSLLPTLRQLCQPGNVLDACRGKLEELEKDMGAPWKGSSKFKTKAGTIAHTLAWPFKDDQMKRILADISRFITIFSLAFAADETVSVLDIRDKTNAMYSTVEHLHELQKDSRKDRQADDILRWLSAPDESMDQSDALQRRLDKTGSWFTSREQYDDWKLLPGSFIWLHGIPGCGKTILTSTVIEDVFRHCSLNPNSAVAYFYFKSDDVSKRDHAYMLRSLIKQLFVQTDGESQALKNLFSVRHKQSPTASQLLSTLKEMVSEFDRTFLVLDALDECDSRHDLLKDLEQICQWKTANLHVLATSRDVEEIKDSLEPICINGGSIPISAALVKEDIRAYIRDSLQTQKGLKRWRNQPKVREEIENVITEKADGMFQWVICQLRALEKCYSPSLLRKVLASLPETLNDTYAQILQKISKENESIALRLFQWLLFSYRPMCIEELAQLAVVDFEAAPLVDVNRQFWEPQDILRICPGLITTVEETTNTGAPKGRTLVRLAHASVREYLLSHAITEGQAAKYSIEMTSAHIAIAEFSLAYTQLFHNPLSDLTDEFPLASYIATYLLNHYQAVPEHACRAHELALDFFLRKKDAYFNWIQFYCSLPFHMFRFHPRLPRDEIVSTSPLNVAATFNLVGVLRLMLQSGEIDTRKESVLQEALRWACSKHLPFLRENIEAVRLLLEHGADFSGGKDFFNNLHGASYYGFDDLVNQQLDEGVDVNITGEGFKTALHAAITGRFSRVAPNPEAGKLLERTDPTTVKLLLKRGADPNLLGCALPAACSNGDIICVQLLLEHGAVPTLPPAGNDDILAAACHSGDIRIVRLMLENGAGINSDEPLWNACRHRSASTVRLLLESGADPNPPDRQGADSPLQISCLLGSFETIKLLVDYGADVNVCNRSNVPPLQKAALMHGADVVGFLIDRGADVNFVGGEWGTALQAASHIGNTETVRVLIAKGADINLGGGVWDSSLHAALNNSHGKVVSLLLKEGADIKTPGGRYGETLRETLASAPETKKEMVIHLEHTDEFVCVLKRNAASFLDFDNITAEERKMQPGKPVEYDCRLPPPRRR